MFNLFIFRIEDNLKKEEEEIKLNLELEKEDNIELKKKLEKIYAKQEEYFHLVSVWYMIITGILIICLVYLFIAPIYKKVLVLP